MDITSARAVVGQQLGFGTDFDGSLGAYQALAPENQIRLDNALATFIVNNPSEFTPQQVSVAQNRVNKPASDIQDTSFDWSAFGDQFLTNTQGFLGSAGSTIRNAIYLAVVVAVIFYLSPYVVPALKKALKE